MIISPGDKRRLLIQRGFTEDEIEEMFQNRVFNAREWHVETISAEEMVNTDKLEDVQKLFEKDSTRNTWGGPSSESFEWYSSIHETDGERQVGASVLEPYIARMVIAVNKCGVFTSMSCDGWHSHSNQFMQKELRLGLRDRYSIIWFLIITEKIFDENLTGNGVGVFAIDNRDLPGFRADIKLKYIINRNDEAKAYKKINWYAYFLERYCEDLCEIREKWMSSLLEKYSCAEIDSMDYTILRNAIVEAIDESDLNQLRHKWEDLYAELEDEAYRGIQAWHFVCPECGGAMVIRSKRIDPESRFLGCENYPRCRGTRSIRDL